MTKKKILLLVDPLEALDKYSLLDLLQMYTQVPNHLHRTVRLLHSVLKDRLQLFRESGISALDFRRELQAAYIDVSTEDIEALQQIEEISPMSDVVFRALFGEGVEQEQQQAMSQLRSKSGFSEDDIE